MQKKFKGLIISPFLYIKKVYKLTSISRKKIQCDFDEKGFLHIDKRHC